MKAELVVIAVLLSTLLPIEAVDPAECMEKFFWCVTTAFPKDKYHKANVECCEKSVTKESPSKSDDFREELSLCTSRKFQDTREKCLQGAENPCRELIPATYSKDGKDYAEFSNKVAAMAKPPSAPAGCDKFIRDSESAEQQLCRQNNKRSLEPMCKVILKLATLR